MLNANLAVIRFEKYICRKFMLLSKGYLQKYKWPWLLSFLFILFYSLEVFYNHYCFRTFALDLGVFTNAIYDYSHLQWNDATVFKYKPENLLSDHFDLYLMVFSPLSYLFGQYTLLIVQITSVVIGAFGVYAYLQLRFNNEKLSLMGMLNFYLFFGIWSALSFDYHSNVVAAMIAPWLFYLIERKRFLNFGLLLAFMLIAKETISIWCFFICIGLLIEYRKDKNALLYLSLFAIVSLSYFIVTIKMIMPSLASSGTYDHFRYAIIGKDINSAFANMLSHPLNAIQNLFLNHSGEPGLDWVKTEFYGMALVSGMYLVVLRPAFLIMLISPLCIKMFNDDPTKWSIDCHYSVEFAAVITIGAFTFIGQLKSEKLKLILPYMVCLGSLIATYKLTDHSIYYHDYNRMKIYHSHHYNRGYDLKKVHASFKLIPDTAIVCAQSPILPHLAYRNTIYPLPFVKNATYIIGSKSEPVCYPISERDFRKLLNDSLATKRWHALVNDTNITILKKIK